MKCCKKVEANKQGYNDFLRNGSKVNKRLLKAVKETKVKVTQITYFRN